MGTCASFSGLISVESAILVIPCVHSALTIQAFGCVLISIPMFVAPNVQRPIRRLAIPTRGRNLDMTAWICREANPCLHTNFVHINRESMIHKNLLYRANGRNSDMDVAEACNNNVHVHTLDNLICAICIFQCGCRPAYASRSIAISLPERYCDLNGVIGQHPIGARCWYCFSVFANNISDDSFALFCRIAADCACRRNPQRIRTNKFIDNMIRDLYIWRICQRRRW